MKYLKHLSILAVLGFFIAGCSSTKIVGSWKDKSLGQGQYANITVAAITSDALAKGNVEQEMSEQLASRGVKAEPAGSMFRPGMEMTDETKAEVSSQLDAAGFDGLLTIALIVESEETRYVPGTTYAYTPYTYGYYSNYWGYYGYYGPQVYEPGYYTTTEVYLVEAVLYDVETEKMVWAARSETTDPASLNAFANDFAATVAAQLEEDGMLK